jgi:outer membrane receptor protein involved in Fe transport
MRAIEKFSLFAMSLILCFALATASFGQAVYGSIFGTVTDTSGGIVPGATLTITNINTNLSETTKSNESGNFNQTRLIPGTYRIKIEASGFKSAVIETVVVNVDKASEVGIQLQPGQLTEEITISAAAPVLKTDRADVAVTFETRQVTDLPMLDRNFTKFILLTPGTQQLGFQHAASENPQGSTQIMVNGQHFSGTGYQLDGTENRDPILGIIVVNPNFEAIGETKITSQNYDAEFGQAIAGVVSVSTKSGTNEIHGAAYAFRLNDLLQARDPFTQSQRNPQGKFIPDTLRNQYGGAVGGPIIKNRIFFFGDYDGIRSKIGGSRLLTVPTVAARGGDFSAYLGDVITRQDPDRPDDPNARIPIMATTVSGASVLLRQGMVFDPRTTVVNAMGQLADRRAFDGNIVPTGLLSQQTQNILQRLIPLPNAPGTNNGTIDNYVASGIEGFDKDSFDFRIDGKGSEKLNLFGRYSFADFRRNGPGVFGLAGGRELVSLAGTSKVRNHSVAFGLDYTWSSSLVTDFRFGFFRYKVNVLPVDFGMTTATDLGVPGLNIDDFSSGLFAAFIDQPGVNNDTNRFEFGSGLGVNRCNCPLDQDENQFQFVSNTTKFLGNHTLKFGVDVRRAYNLRIPSDSHRAGELTFGNDRTSGVGGGGLGVATFLLGDVTTFDRYISTNFNARERQWRHFYYGQDSWRVNQKLTFNYGLRLDMINPQTLNEPGNGGFVNQDTGEVLVAGIGDVNMAGNIENSVNFAPRLALAYRATDRLVLRVGYGRSYDIGVFGSLFGHSVTQNLPVLARQNLNAPANFERVFTLDQGPPGVQFFGLNAPPNQGGTPNTSLPANGRFFLPDGVNSFVLPPKQRLPSVDAYNATIQWQLTDTISLETGYVGNKGTHVFAGDGPDTNNNMATLEGFGTIPLNNRKPFFNQFGWTQDFRYFCNCADNRYDSWQTKIDKRFSKGYSLLAHYTLQRAVQNHGDYFFIDRSLNRGPAGWDRKHSFVFSQVWELPIGRGRRFFNGISRSLDWVVGGWQFNSNTTIQSGRPFNVIYNTSGNIDTGGDESRRPNIDGDPNFELSGNAYSADLSVFTTPARGTFGNLKRNAFRGPGYWRTDASLFKKMRFTESKELEFRIEAINFFNHVNRNNPAANINSDNFGVISSVAYDGNDPMRNFQFALRFKF